MCILCSITGNAVPDHAGNRIRWTERKLLHKIKGKESLYGKHRQHGSFRRKREGVKYGSQLFDGLCESGDFGHLPLCGLRAEVREAVRVVGKSVYSSCNADSRNCDQYYDQLAGGGISGDFGRDDFRTCVHRVLRNAAQYAAKRRKRG